MGAGWKGWVSDFARGGEQGLQQHGLAGAGGAAQAAAQQRVERRPAACGAGGCGQRGDAAGRQDAKQTGRLHQASAPGKGGSHGPTGGAGRQGGLP